MRQSPLARIALSAVMIATALGGCTAIRRDRAPETTSLLIQAGFKTLPADTPERMAKLKALTPYKVVQWTRKSGATAYAYADPDLCKCVYVGSPKQYAKYGQLLSAQEAAEIDRRRSRPRPSRRSSRSTPSKKVAEGCRRRWGRRNPRSAAGPSRAPNGAPASAQA